MAQNEYVTTEDVRRELNSIESFLAGLSTDDEFLEAIVHNQRLMGLTLLQLLDETSDGSGLPGGGDGGDDGDSGSGGGSELEIDSIGIATEDISSGSSGSAVFNVNGSWQRVTVNSGQDISDNDILIVTGEGNEVVPSTEVTRDYLNIISRDETELAYPNRSEIGLDVTPSDKTIGPISVSRVQSIILVVNETSGGSLDVSVEWLDGDDNVLQTESPADINMANVSDDWSRLVRKGSHIKFTLSDRGGATDTNVYIDTHG